MEHCLCTSLLPLSSDKDLWREAKLGMRPEPLVPGQPWTAALPEMLRHTIFMPMNGRVSSELASPRNHAHAPPPILV